MVKAEIISKAVDKIISLLLPVNSNIIYVPGFAKSLLYAHGADDQEYQTLVHILQ